MMRIVAVLLLTLGASLAAADIPVEYNPLVVEAPFSFSERVFDLTSAVDRANRENKPLYIYLGADDCPPCKAYSAFLQKNRELLKASFDRVIFVDIRTWLKGPALVFKIGGNRYSLAKFKALVGDANRSLTYPYFWLLTPSLRQVKQLPLGTANYMPVDKQIEILRLP
ncbi:MAG: thioredoxin family protein [Pseudomonadota bacterium]